jgi:hypothetical protein
MTRLQEVHVAPQSSSRFVPLLGSEQVRELDETAAARGRSGRGLDAALMG